MREILIGELCTEAVSYDWCRHDRPYEHIVGYDDITRMEVKYGIV